MQDISVARLYAQPDMTILKIRHLTRYRYANPVEFGEHRMMFRPRESFDQHVLDCHLKITPEPSDLRYMHDVFGNCIGIARFGTKARELTFESINVLDHNPENALEAPSTSTGGMNSYPFAYVPSDLPDVYSSMLRGYPDPDRAVEVWSRRFLQGLEKVDAIHALSAMTRSIHKELTYVSRRSGKPQTPAETLSLSKGTCRDFAVLMMEGARALGLATRFVSGYLHVPAATRDGDTHRGGGNTHAWVRVFLPEGGWVEFDPTNGLIGNRDLVRVAVVRDPSQALPLYGTWEGKGSDYLGMDVEVEVSAIASSAVSDSRSLHKKKALSIVDTGRV
jgi:transglutaminase-like putative cysteine protease